MVVGSTLSNIFWALFGILAINFFQSSVKNQNEQLKKLDELIQILRKDNQP